MISTRICSDCGVEKALDAYALQKRGREAHRSHCKPCGVLRTTKWQRENIARKRITGLRWHHKHKETANAKQRARRKKPEVRTKERAYQKAYRKAHPDTTTRVWHARWKKKYPERVKELACIRAKRRYARLKGAAGDSTPEQVRARVAYYGERCWMCGGVANELDHVKPLAKGGSHWPSNLRPACGKCNRVKADTWPLVETA